MKAYKVTLLIIDHDNLGAAGIEDALASTRYPNRCIRPIVVGSKEADIGEWSDDHPLNQRGSRAAPGFMSPEGIVVYHTAGGYLFKMTLDKSDAHKGA